MLGGIEWRDVTVQGTPETKQRALVDLYRKLPAATKDFERHQLCGAPTTPAPLSLLRLRNKPVCAAP